MNTIYENQMLDQVAVLLMQELAKKITSLITGSPADCDVDQRQELMKRSQQLAVEARLFYGRSECESDHDAARARLLELRSILNYSLWFNRKLEKQRNHLKKVPYHINLRTNQDYGAMFLPVHYETLAVMRMMHDINCAEGIHQIHQDYEEEDMAVWGLLDCRIKPWLEYRKYPNRTKHDKVLILCYDWQEGLVKKFFREIVDQKEIWIQVLTGQMVLDLFYDKIDFLPYGPYQL